jgi:hypothetical protein
VGAAKINGSRPDDHYCWNRPEDMAYPRPTISVSSAPDLGGEIAAALAAASIVFRDNPAYSKKLTKGAATVYKFARQSGHRTLYSLRQPDIQYYYNSTSYWDEYMWSASWMYYATGNTSYISFATDPRLPKNAKAFFNILDFSVFSWDNKLPGAQLLLSRLRMFLNPGYPYEESLIGYHNATSLNMCMYFPKFAAFNFTKGGMALFNHGKGQPLQYVVANSFLASLYADYMEAVNVPGWYCGPNFMTTNDLRDFAKSQVSTNFLAQAADCISLTVMASDCCSTSDRAAQLHSWGQPEEDELRGGVRQEVPAAPAPPGRIHAEKRCQVLLHRRVQVARLQEGGPEPAHWRHGRRPRQERRVQGLAQQLRAERADAGGQRRTRGGAGVHHQQRQGYRRHRRRQEHHVLRRAAHVPCRAAAAGFMEALRESCSCCWWWWWTGRLVSAGLPDRWFVWSSYDFW